VTRTGHLATAAGVGVACLAVIIPPTTASAGSVPRPAARAPQPRVQVLNDQVVAPYQIEVTRDGLFVADAYENTLSRLGRRGLQQLVEGPPDGEVDAVAVNGRGDLAYTTRVADDRGVVSSKLIVVPHRGRSWAVDLLRYEQRFNPDREATYGVVRPNQCQRDAFASLGGATKRGVADSRGAAVTALPDGAWAVADGAANDLLKVDARGRVGTLAVLPAQPVRITREAAEQLRLPRCVIGATYVFEPTPTDVELLGEDLVVSLLPSGPADRWESLHLGARGSVQWVDARRGRVRTIADGFLGATGLTVGPRGRIFVAEGLGDQISLIDGRRVVKYADLDRVVSVKWANDRLYAGTMGDWDDKGQTELGYLVALG
jgi:hypothetical protein